MSKNIHGFDHPLAGRYASNDMLRLFSPVYRYTCWRRLWLVLAESEKELGLDISDRALEQMRAHVEVTEDDFEKVRIYEKETRHDVMAHLHAFADHAPAAKAILHLGATSAYVGDNADLVIAGKALDVVISRILALITALKRFAEVWADLPTLGFTHFQAAQPTTVGKRACLWIQDFAFDLERLRFERGRLRLRGAKGTTGTQATYFELFDGDDEKVRELDRRVAEKMGFQSTYGVTGQTYPRKVDAFWIDALSGVAQSATKMATDIRLLAHLKELREPLAAGQVGSSAMPYKANPMRCERVTSLARWLMSIAANPAHTAANQWLERSLDDSANRRMSLPEAFLCTDAILVILHNVSDGMCVFPAMVRRNLAEEMPFMASEAILMAAVVHGGDRQEIHEKLRIHARKATDLILQSGEKSRFLDFVAEDEMIPLNRDALQKLLDPQRFVGRAPQQVREFLKEEIDPLLQNVTGLPEVFDLDV